MNFKAFVAGTLLGAFILSGCASRAELDRLRYENIKKQRLLNEQSRLIRELQAKLKHARKLQKQKQLKRKKTQSKKRTTASTLPKKPKKNIKLKKVEDKNYSPEYMYPDTHKKKQQPKPAPLAQNATMDKKQCIAMIGEEKFTRYTQMFGSEAAAIKRCTLMRSLRR